MSATVQPGGWGGWRAYCPECNESCVGSMAPVDLWSDVHNETNHKDSDDHPTSS